MPWKWCGVRIAFIITGKSGMGSDNVASADLCRTQKISAPTENERTVTGMAECAKRACRDCFHYMACKSMLEASGLGDYVSSVSNGDRCPDFVHAADVAPVRHGRWELSKNYVGYCSCSLCSDCYVEPEWVDRLHWRFCPNCGAKMDLEASDGKA